MSIRTKLLWLLLGIALLPLLAATAVAQTATRSLGADFVGQTRQYLLDDTRQKLEQIVRAYASYVQRTVESLNVAVTVQAIEAADALTAAEVPAARGAWVLAYDLDAAASLPADWGPSADYTIWSSGSERAALPVSWSHQSVVAAPGVDPATVEDQANRLARLTERYRVLRQMQPGLIHWQFAATEQGVHASYPAHGGYPDGYDPRTRPWYRNALLCVDRTGYAAPTWSTPIIDATSRYAMLTVSHAVLDSAGAVVGVTGLDIRLSDILGRIDDWRESWTRDADVAFIVAGADVPGADAQSILVFARRDYDAQTHSWTTPLELSPLDIADPAHAAIIHRALMERSTATVRAVINGREALCVVATISAGEADASGPNNGTGHAAVLMAVPIESILEMVDTAEAGFLGRMRVQLATNLGIVLAVAAGVVILALISSRTVTRPIGSLASTAQRIAEGDLDARAEIDRGDEIGRLGRIFNEMVPRLRDGLRMSASLEMAKQVQQRFLPEAAPKHPGHDIAGLSRYCDETGGDYYDFIHSQRDGSVRTGIALGDVTGHGIAAAMLMATGRALLRSRMIEPGSMAAHLAEINRDLCRDAGDGRFMTLALVVLEDQHAIRWASAGHDPAIIYDPACASFRELEGGGIPLGIEPSWEFDEHVEPPLPVGGVLVLGTDGIWEARNAEGAMFGKARLRETIAAHAGRGSQQIAEAILAAVDAFRGKVPQADDITMVVIKRTG